MRVDQWPAPLDPNFTGLGRALTDSEGRYRFTTIKPGAYPWGNHDNAWRPAHIHFSLFGRAFTQRLVTQMYFPDDPLFAHDPIFNSIPDASARQRLVSRFDLDTTQPSWALSFVFDIVLRGSAATPFEDPEDRGRMTRLPLTPSQTVGPFLHIALVWDDGADVVPEGAPGAVWLRGRVYDGAGAPLPDALVETWQADVDGRFDHPDDPRGAVAAPTGLPRLRPVRDRAGRRVGHPHGQARRRAGGRRPAAGAAHRRVRLRARAARPRGHPPLLLRRGRRERHRPRAVHRPGAPSWDASSRNAPMTAITSTSDCREMARLSSSTSEPSSTAGPGLFDEVYGSAATCAATSDRSWLQAMLDVEAALAVAGARVGLLPATAAASIAAACRVELYDVAAIARGAATDATPVVELVRQLRALVPADVQPHVHLVATSQDIVDSATMLVARRALEACLVDARAVASALASLAREHRDTVQVGRTLLQHGAVTTFGAVCAGRLVAVDDAVAGVARVLRDRLAVQLGGAVGTLAPAGDRGAALVAEVAPRAAAGRTGRAVAHLARAGGRARCRGGHPGGRARRRGAGHRAALRDRGRRGRGGPPRRFLGHGAQAQPGVRRTRSRVCAPRAGVGRDGARGHAAGAAARHRPLAGGVGHADRPVAPRRRDRAPHCCGRGRPARRPRPHARARR